MRLVSVNAVMKELNLSERRVHQLVQEGLPRAGHGKYDLRSCMRWYIRYLQRKLQRGAVSIPGPDGLIYKETSLRIERILLLSVKRKLKEFQLAKMIGECVAISDVQTELIRLFTDTEARLLSVGWRVAPELVGETNFNLIQAKVDRVVKDVLSHLGSYELKGLTVLSRCSQVENSP